MPEAGEADEQVVTGWSTPRSSIDRRKKILTLLLIALCALLLRAFFVVVVHPACPGDDEAWATGKALELDYLRNRVSNPPSTANECFELGGDPLSTVAQAHMLASGKGMSSPAVYALSGRFEDGAARPPAWEVAIAALYLAGLRTPTDARLLAAVLGGLAVMVIGHVAWQLAGRKAGIAAAVIAALYPCLVINDFHLLNDGPYALIVAVTIWLAYRFWLRPSYWRAAALGAMFAFGYYTRSETLGLVVFMAVPLVMLLKGVSLRRRLALTAVVAVMTVGLVVPYWAWNMSRFHQQNPTLGSGVLLLNASCDDTYYGKYMGMVGFSCFGPNTKSAIVKVSFTPGTDESDVDEEWGKLASDYVSANIERLPFVAAVRVLRVYQVYDPGGNTRFDINVERRGNWEPWAGLFMYYALIPFTIAGFVALRRRRIPISPFLAWYAVVTITVALSFGLSRYRASVDVTMCILGGIGVSSLLTWWKAKRDAQAADPDAPTVLTAAVDATVADARASWGWLAGLDNRIKIAGAVVAVLFAGVMLVSWQADPDPAFAQQSGLTFGDSRDLVANASGQQPGNGSTTPGPGPQRECEIIANNRQQFTDFTAHATSGKLTRPNQVYLAFDRLQSETDDAQLKADTTVIRDVVAIARDQNLSITDASNANGPEGRQAYLEALQRVLTFVSDNCPQVK